MKKLCILPNVLLILSSCSTPVIITSSIPARVERDGQFYCNTPCEIRYGGVTRAFSFMAFPLDKSLGSTQTKSVTLYQDGENKIDFDMQSLSAVKTYEQVGKKEINNSDQDENSESRKEKELIFLKKMREQGTIDDQTYKELLQKTIKN